MIKKTGIIIALLVFFPALSFSGSLQDAHRAVIAKKNTGGGGSYTVAYVAMSESDTPATSISKPTGTLDGHIMIAGCIDDTVEATTWAAGWTEIVNVDNPSSKLSAAYKVASSEGASYQFTSANADESCFIATFSKSGGTWAITDFGSSFSNNDTFDTGEVTAVDNSILIVVYGSDDGGAVVTPPASMTIISDLFPGSRSIASWYEASSSGNITKSITGTSGDNKTSISVVINAN